MSKSDWKFSQVFGERSHNDPVEYVDIISAIEFEGRGDYLATGDHGGRVVLFERVNGKNPHSQKELEKMDQTAEVHPKYVYKTEFQSHVPEFDYLKSLNIEEKINKLRWCASPNDSLLMLSTNDKTIKLWKVLEHKAKKVKQMVQMDVIPHVNTENALLAEKSFVGGPNASSVANDFHLEWINKKLESTSPIYQEGSRMSFNTGDGVSSRCRRLYAHAHDYNINSISNNSDGETFISADDLKINLWNMEISNQCFNIINMKPDNMEDLVEVITSAEFHPAYCNLLAYSSSRGFIRLADMRQSALCDQHARILQDYDVYGSKSFFAEIASSISDMKFTKDGRYILSRDYMNLKLWDLNMERSPVATFKIHEHLRPQLTELYNSDAIFDKFDCCLSRDGRHFASGSYSNTFKIFSSDDGPNGGIALEASRTPNRISEPQPALKAPRLFTSFSLGHNRRGHDTPSFESNGIPYDLKSKLIHLAWHPTANTIACAASNSLYMYHS